MTPNNLFTPLQIAEKVLSAPETFRIQATAQTNEVGEALYELSNSGGLSLDIIEASAITLVADTLKSEQSNGLLAFQQLPLQEMVKRSFNLIERLKGN